MVRRAKKLESGGKPVLIRDSDGRLYTLGQFLARPEQPDGLTPEDLLVGARTGTR